MELYVQLSKFSRFIQLVLVILFLTFFDAKPQGGILDVIKDVAGAVDKTVLDLTQLSDDEENQIGKELETSISKGLSFSNSGDNTVKKVFNKILPLVGRKKINYRYKIVNNNEVNAFTIAGGMIYIHTGLLDFVKTEDELAFVIAHEIAHNELKHCVKKIQHGVNASKINPLLGSIVQYAYSVYHLPFSKDEEYEADKFGVKLAIQAGYSKKGAIDFFGKLFELEKKYQNSSKNPLNDFISTHPYADQRKKKIEELK